MVGDVAQRVAIVADGADHFLERGTLARKLGILAIIGDYRWIADAPLQFGEALFDSLQLIEHRHLRRDGARAALAARDKNLARLPRVRPAALSRPIPRPPGRIAMRRGK